MYHSIPELNSVSTLKSWSSEGNNFSTVLELTNQSSVCHSLIKERIETSKVENEISVFIDCQVE